MAQERQRWLVTYDIEDDRLRQRVASLLEGVGFRVQLSVFECVLERDGVDRLAARLSGLLERDAGETRADLRIYRLCASCFAASFGLGDVERGSGGDPWIVV